MLDFRLNYNMCTIDWQPEEEDAEDEDETDDNGTDEGADDEGSDDEAAPEDDEGSDDEGDTGEDDDDEPIDHDLEGRHRQITKSDSNVNRTNRSRPARLPQPSPTTLTVGPMRINATAVHRLARTNRGPVDPN